MCQLLVLRVIREEDAARLGDERSPHGRPDEVALKADYEVEDVGVELRVEGVVGHVVPSRPPARESWRLVVDEKPSVLDRGLAVGGFVRQGIDLIMLGSGNVRPEVEPGLSVTDGMVV